MLFACELLNASRLRQHLAQRTDEFGGAFIAEDDGVGFDVARFFNVEGQSFGLRSMRDRAEALGGTFQILSAPGSGTRVIVEVPCQSASAGLRMDYENPVS